VLLMPLSCRWCCHMCVLLLPMQERLTRAEWVAAAIASLGILCLGLSSEPGPTPSPSPPAATGVSPGASPAGVAEGGTTQAAQIQAAAVAGALSSSARAGAAGGAAPLPDAGEARAALLVRGSLQGSGSRFYRVGGGGGSPSRVWVFRCTGDRPVACSKQLHLHCWWM
jgi:drug/metabolite transporter (DMT)-like permease